MLGPDPADPRTSSPVCPGCGYSLVALPAAGLCPECGRGYDPVTLANLPDPRLERRNRAAWAAVLLPVVLMGMAGAMYGAWRSTTTLIVAPVVAMITVAPLANHLQGMARFHPPARLTGASIAGLFCVAAGWFIALNGFGPGGAGFARATPWHLAAPPIAAIIGPMVALAYAAIGRSLSRRAQADIRRTPTDGAVGP